MKAFVIGDVHGCLTELKEILKGVDRNTTRVILVGDVIDRGKDSKGVIDFVRDNDIECVQGNHEVMAIECYTQIKKERIPYGSDWFNNGGKEVFESYKDKNELLEDLQYLNRLPKFIKTGIKDDEDKELLVSHTWTSDYTSLDISQKSQDFVWNRDQPLVHKDKYYNIFGHTPVDYLLYEVYHKRKEVIPEPIFYPSGCNLDTGCCYTSRGRGYLSGVFFPSLEIKQVKRKDT